MQLVNLTPHAIVLRDAVGVDHIIPPSGVVARVMPMPGYESLVEGVPVPVYAPDSFGSVEGLPEPDGESLFIVSYIVARAISGRLDVVRPGTGPNDGVIRDEEMRIVAVTRLIRA